MRSDAIRLIDRDRAPRHSRATETQQALRRRLPEARRSRADAAEAENHCGFQCGPSASSKRGSRTRTAGGSAASRLILLERERHMNNRRRRPVLRYRDAPVAPCIPHTMTGQNQIGQGKSPPAFNAAFGNPPAATRSTRARTGCPGRFTATVRQSLSNRRTALDRKFSYGPGRLHPCIW